MKSIIDKKIFLLGMDKHHPENLLFYENEELFQMLQEGVRYPDPESIIANIAAELLLRYSLCDPTDKSPESHNRASKILDALHSVFSDDALSDMSLLNNFRSSASQPPFIPWKTTEGYSEQFKRILNQRTYKRFSQYYHCDGFIPVESERFSKGFAIPFELIRISANQPFVEDLSGTILQNWSNSIRNSSWNNGYSVKLCFYAQDILHGLGGKKTDKQSVQNSDFANTIDTIFLEKTDEQFGNNSLQLPIYLAILRKEKIFPQYSPVSVMASGVINNDSFGLSEVNVGLKLDYLKKRFSKFIFLTPTSKETESLVKTNNFIKPIYTDSTLGAIKEFCQKKIEAANVDSLDMTYIKERLPVLFSNINKSTQSEWKSYITILIELAKKVSDSIKAIEGIEVDNDNNSFTDVAPNSSKEFLTEKLEVYINILSSLSYALCNDGQTNEAQRYNKEAFSLAIQYNLQRHLLPLAIENIVVFQDLERLDLIPEKVQEITLLFDNENNLIEQNELDRNYMNFYGTMAQANMFGAVCNYQNDSIKFNFTIKAARFDVTKAISFAEKIADQDHIARNYNYKHLYYALFEPGTTEEQKAFEEAQKESYKLSDSSYNQNYLHKQRAMAAYRFLLINGIAPNERHFTEFELTLPFPNNAPAWMHSLTNKYRGAILVARGEIDKATELFDTAIEIPANEKDSLLLVYFRVTAAVQACYSFAQINDTNRENKYRTEAKRLFDTFEKLRISQNIKPYFTSVAWKEFIDTPWEEFKKSGKPFPGINYYY